MDDVLRARANAGLRPLFAAKAVVAAVISVAMTTLPGQAAEPETPSPALSWSTVANNNDTIPGTDKTFNAYNQPSINNGGTVVFRARSKGPERPERGIFTRNMATLGPIVVVARGGGGVPAPNNLSATFNEFPSFPRIDLASKTVAFRGQSTPVWQTVIDGVETRLGTAGVYTNPGGELLSGAKPLGAVAEFPCFRVPFATPVAAAIPFDQFPGAPSAAGASRIVFKGNFEVDSVGKTGVFYRLASQPVPVPCITPAVQIIASSDTRIPNQPAGETTKFGSTAPPSAARDRVVFYGTDNEDSPTKGGIYLAPLKPKPPLTTIVGIGGAVPGVAGQTFKQFGEGLSFDGRYVGFWGAWGTATRTVALACPEDGNTAITEECNRQCPGGTCTRAVPVNQGIFVHDTTTRATRLVARTNTGVYEDFLFWVFSGRPPGVGGGDDGGDDQEPPRWRSSAFVASAAWAPDISKYNVAFKALKSVATGLTGIYLTRGPGNSLTTYDTAVDTTTAGTAVDPEAPSGSVVATVGIEREGLRRNSWLAINASMVDPVTTESIAGVYVTKVPRILP